MAEWILLLTLNLAGGAPGEVRDMSATTIGGFTSRQTCDAAANKLAERLVVLAGKHREREGVARGGSKLMPVTTSVFRLPSEIGPMDYDLQFRK